MPHIHENIFFSLDYESYKSCTEVCKAWNELLTSEAYQEKGRSLFRDGILKDEDLLHDASKHRNKDAIRRLLSPHLVDVNCVGPDGAMTPLHMSACLGHKDAVQLLIDRGADQNKADSGGRIP